MKVTNFAISGTALGLLLSSLLVACEGHRPQPLEVSSGGTDAPTGDAYDTETIGGSGDTRSGDCGSDSCVTDGSDGSGYTGEDAETGDDVGPWKRSNRCDETVTYAPPERQFSKPDREYLEKPHTKEMMKNRWGDGGFPSRAYATVPAENLEPGPDRAFDLYANQGEDATFHLAYVVNPDKLRRKTFEGRYLWISMLVDYQPVQFQYEIWNGDRSKVVRSGQTSGLRLDQDDYVKILDLTIPASALPEARMYELALMSVYEEHRGISSAGFDRFILYYGGLERPANPCFEPPLEEELNAVERFFHGNDDAFHGYFGATLHQYILFPDRIRDEALAGDTDAVAKYPEAYKVEPGDELTLNVSATTSTYPEVDEPSPTVMRPFVNGKPMEEKWNITTVTTREEPGDEVNARKQFVFEAPKEPGLYNIMVGSWPDAYQKAFEGLPRERNEGVRIGTSGFASNIVRVEVVGSRDSD